MNSKCFLWLLGGFACLSSQAAFAYVGPGAGLTLLSALWGLVVAMGVAVGFVLFWPIRRWRRRQREDVLEHDHGDEIPVTVEGRRAATPRDDA